MYNNIGNKLIITLKHGDIMTKHFLHVELNSWLADVAFFLLLTLIAAFQHLRQFQRRLLAAAMVKIQDLGSTLTRLFCHEKYGLGGSKLPAKNGPFLPKWSTCACFIQQQTTSARCSKWKRTAGIWYPEERLPTQAGAPEELIDVHF